MQALTFGGRRACQRRGWAGRDGNVVALAENARMELDEDDLAELDGWILGSLRRSRR